MYEADILYSKLNWIDAMIKITKFTIILWKDIIYVAECYIKVSGSILFDFLQKPLFEACLVSTGTFANW